MNPAGVLAASKDLWHRLRDRTRAYLANEDPLAAASNSGAFLVWGNQPFYPIYAWLLVGNDAWPSLLTWLSTPLFVAVPFLARVHSIAGRALFVGAGVGNTLLSVKAFGLDTQVGWFLAPCLILAVGFLSEWRASAGLTLATVLAGAAIPFLGPSIHRYSDEQARSLSHLNLWSVAVLSLYLIYAAIRARSQRHA